MKSSPSIWHYVVDVKSTVKISSIVVAFLVNTNFTDEVETQLNINIHFVLTNIWQCLSVLDLWVWRFSTHGTINMKHSGH